MSMQIHDLDPESTLSFEDFHQLLSERGGPITFRATHAPKRQKDFFPADASEEVIVSVSRPGVSERGTPQLIRQLWLEFPKVAAFLEYPLWHCGAVTFSATLREQARNVPASNLDPITTTVAWAIQQGMRVTPLAVPATSNCPADDPAPLIPSRPTPTQTALGEMIQQTPPQRLLENISSLADAQAVLAGLLMWHDLLDESHQISQSIEGEGQDANGDYWHAIMHRREPDFGNAKYWFRRVGHHPIHAELAFRAKHTFDAIPSLETEYSETWSSTAFVDACESAARSSDEDTDLALRRCQADEMLLLLLHTCHSAR